MAKKKKVDETPLVAEELQAETQAEAQAEAAAMDTGSQLVDEEQAKVAMAEAGADADAVVAAEDAAVHADTDAAREASGEPVAPMAAPVQPGKPKHRSGKYLKAAEAIDARKYYALSKAIELAKETSYAKFDGSLELHVRLAPRKKAESDSIRGLLQLPHGTGKTVNAVILTEELIEEIAKTGKTSADILIATPALMPKVAKIAKILGPQGKMPSPKAGTVSESPEDALAALQSGRIEYRADKGGIIHQAIGKLSWDSAKLEENARAVLGALGGFQLLSVNLSATMGPGVRVDTSSF